MQVIRPVGRAAAARKYDLLSALMAFALAGDQHRQRLVLRFMALVTTRYNWQRDELTMGQREIARLWCVDERTVKRDMARLRAQGWVRLHRQGARGRVAVLGFDWDRIMEDTRGQWANIGPDFAERAGEGAAGVAGQGVAGSTVVPFRRPVPGAGADGWGGDGGGRGEGGGIWAAAAARLSADEPALFSAWFATLAEAGVRDGCLHLAAPSRFQASYIHTHLAGRLLSAVRLADPSIRAVAVDGG